MNRIRLLSEQVANQIAAGEVVERPASVVKELVENALDARAARITVEVQAGGRSLIRVTDDGMGMSRDDALLCLERHATSKIQSAEDLSAIRTMGFRGEAVPSIASVSRMAVITRERNAEAGTQIVIHGGRILEVKEAGSAPGTCVEVRNLFFNLPARRKFLRTEQTERAHIQHYLSLAALAFPEVAFTFMDDQRVIWQLPQVKKDPERPIDLPALNERLRGLYGAELKLLGVDYVSSASESPSDEPENGSPAQEVRVWGFIGAPGVSRATRDEQHLFVNRRPVENRGLNYALLEGYHTALMKGRFPVCCLFVEIDPAAVDVNIHPAKREVKFHQESRVRRVVTQAVREALLTFHAQGPGSGELRAQEKGQEVEGPAPESAGSPQGAEPQVESRSANGQVQGASRQESPSAEGPSGKTADARVNADRITLRLRSELEPKQEAAEVELPNLLTGMTSRPGPSWSAPIETAALGQSAGQEAAAATPGSPQARTPNEPVPLLQVPLRLLGVIGQLYVVLESDRGLVLLDQHAAHERILFEQTLRRLEQGHAPSQRLLLPETIELAPRDAQFLREQLTSLTRLGVGLSEFGDRTFLLDGLPPFVKASDARRFVLELVDALKATGEGVNSWRLGEHTVAKTVCRHAVKANDPLAGAELENLVSDLRQCEMPYTCPHGRPTLIEMSFRELEKKFGRVQ